jgi:hypothetical protein
MFRMGIRRIKHRKAMMNQRSMSRTKGIINNNPSFRLKHPGVPDGFNGSDGTSNPLKVNYTLPVAQATGCVAYSLPLLCARYTHNQNDTCVTLFAAAAVML